MKAYNMTSDGGKNTVVRIVKDNYQIVKNDKGEVLQKLGGPIGGSNILPLNYGDKDEFVPFKIDETTLISNQSEMKKAYDVMYSTGSKIEEVEKPEENSLTDADDEEDDDVEDVPVRKPGRPKKA